MYIIKKDGKYFLLSKKEWKRFVNTHYGKLGDPQITAHMNGYRLVAIRQTMGL